MKKMICVLLALAMLLCTFAMAETIAPQAVEVNTSEGTYPVSFKRENLEDGVLKNVQLYTLDQYAPEIGDKIAVGDTLVIGGETVAIKTLEKDEYGTIDINGGYEEEGGYTLTRFEPDPELPDVDIPDCYMSTSYSETHSYTAHDTLDLPLAENVTFTDKWDIDMAAIEEGRQPLTATGIEAVTQAIMGSENESFDTDNTELVLKDGKVVEIIRSFTP